MVVPECSVANSSIVNPQINPHMPAPISERPPDTAFNIGWGHQLLQNTDEGLCSPSMSPMDSSPPSEMDYVERMITDNNMDIEVCNLNIPHEPVVPNQNHPIKMPQHTCDNNKAVPNASMEPAPHRNQAPQL